MIKSLNKSLTKETLKIFWQLTKTEWPLASAAMLVVVVLAIGQAVVPFLYKELVDLMTAMSPQMADLPGKKVLFLVALAGALMMGLRRIQDWTSIEFQPRIKQKLILRCYDYLQGHSLNFFNNNFSGSLVRRINRFERAYEDISDQVIFSLGQVAIRVGVVLIAAGLRSFWFSLVILIWVILYSWVSYAFAKKRMKYDLATSEQDSKVTGFLSDTIGNSVNIKLFNGTKSEHKELVKLVAEQMLRLKASWNFALRSDLIQGLLIVSLEVASMYVVFKLWQQGKVTVGDFALMQAYVTQITSKLWDFGRNVRRIYQALADANEMTEILLAPHEVVDVPEASALKVPSGEVNLSGVSFGYNKNEKVFKKFDLKIAAGERVALVGSSGGGKTTIVKLLFRFFDIQAGQILIDGQDISQVTQESLRKNIALVPQEPILFHRSLLENIRYAKAGASREEVVRASKLAHCHEFISKFSEGYDTFVGERGVKLSGGERQRVAIARAILKNAPILVLDEATSSLDSESEQCIQQALKNLMKDKTTIVIAHRLSTIMQMDRIVVLQNGKVKEQGKHEELLKAKQGTYQKLWEIQAGGFS